MRILTISWVFTFCLVSKSIQSQDSLKAKAFFNYGLQANYGFVFAHSNDVENTSNSFPRGLTAALNWQRTDKQILDQYNCFPRQSLLLAIYDFDNSILGKGVNLAYSLEPHFMINQQLSFYPKVSIGAAILSNPSDPIKNPTNKSYSLPVNAYLALGVGMHWQFNSWWAINLTAEYQHVSNGGLREPNLGINWPTAGLGIEYSPRGLELKKYARSKESNENLRALRMDMGILGIVKGGNINAVRVYEPIAGINFTATKQVNRLHAWTAAVEFYQDQFLVERLASEAIESTGLRAGALAGHEFLLGKFIFSQQVGVYILGQYNNDLLYHRWGLQYSFLPRWHVGVNLKAHKQVADFTDVRVSYSFWKR
jgi:Lipid A 3-O-deacylase (PagL)